MIDNRCIYFPALSTETVDKKKILHKNGKSFRFYNKDSIFYYPNFLSSAGIHLNRKEFVKELEIDLKNTIILGDSGGYQLVTGKLKQSMETTDKILNWLENNTTYGMNLDFPPRDQFKERLDISYQNYQYFYEHKQNKTKLMNVLHGPTLDRLNIWYDRIKDFDFPGGWGMGSLVGSNIFYFLLNFFFLFEKGEIEKHSAKEALIHFLGFSRIKDMPILLYLQHKLNKMNLDVTITFDSSSPILSAAYGNYYLSLSETGYKQLNIPLKIITNKEHVNLEENMPCNCPVCKNLTLKDVLINHLKNGGEKSIFYLYVGCHNLYKLLEFKFNIENVMRFDNRTIYENTFNTSLIEIFGIIDKAFEDKFPSKYIQRHKNVIDSLDKDEKEMNSKLSQFFN